MGIYLVLVLLLQLYQNLLLTAKHVIDEFINAGIVCSSSNFDIHYSHVSLLWPLLAIEVDFGT